MANRFRLSEFSELFRSSTKLHFSVSLKFVPKSALQSKDLFETLVYKTDIFQHCIALYFSSHFILSFRSSIVRTYDVPLAQQLSENDFLAEQKKYFLALHCSLQNIQCELIEPTTLRASSTDPQLCSSLAPHMTSIHCEVSLLQLRPYGPPEKTRQGEISENLMPRRGWRCNDEAFPV